LGCTKAAPELAMTIKQVQKWGNPRWEVNFSKIGGRMHRQYFTSKGKAEAAASVENIDKNAKS
jgi:hypothetical protein